MLALVLASACGSEAITSSSATPVAVESPPAAIDPAARAACEAGLGHIPIATTLPTGVVEDTSDRTAVIAAAQTWDLPAGVTFALLGAPGVSGDRVVIRGELVNATEAPVDVFLSEAGVGYFSATLVGDDLVRRTFPPTPAAGPPRPALFPEPHRFTLAPGVHWPIETSVTLLCWQLTRPTTVRAHWWLNVEGESLEGEVPVALPPV
jgi:hypothetical protein